MFGTTLCVLALVASYLAGRKSLLLGICATLLTGYLYGIVRANVPSSASHFIFDCAVGGLYLACLFASPSSAQSRESMQLRTWVIVLCAWPILLLAVPNQDTLIQLVGLRTGVFLLPCILFGARLDDQDVNKLALWCAWLNIGAFLVAGAQFLFGLEPFLPHNAVTALVYQQKDVAGYKANRIPSTFPTAAAFGATMVVTFPLLLGAWTRARRGLAQRGLLLAAMFASGLGVFLAASRVTAVLFAVLVIVATLSGRMRLRNRVGVVLGIVLLGWLVSGETRLQRFSTLSDTEFVLSRVRASVNKDIVDVLTQYPFGNGLGGGGSNIPYFLRSELRNPIAIENEYARIALEQGFPGLMLWLSFLVWAFARSASANSKDDNWRLGRRLAWWTGVLYFGTAWIGLGLLASVPMAMLLLLLTGWMVAGPIAARTNRLNAKPQLRAPLAVRESA